jgi:hypothetical protein
LIGVYFAPVLDFDLPHHVAHVDQRGVPQLLLGKHTATLEVVFIELCKSLIEGKAIVDLEEAKHICNWDALVVGVSRDFVEEDMVDIN